jgi:MraZ protein
MTTFVGDFPVKVDAKGRILFPAAFKKQLSEVAEDRFVVKKDLFSNCLILYPYDEWLRQVKIIRSRINPYNKTHAQFLRQFYKGTAEVSLDSNGRLSFPKRLLEMVGIEKEMTMAGQDGKIELWDTAAYQSEGLSEEDFSKLGEQLLGFGSFNDLD